jgi:hypothetical protein
MLSLEAILTEANRRYSKAKLGNPDRVEIQSDQVKALAATLVEAINQELADVDIKHKILFGGSRTGKTLELPMRRS